MDPITRRAFLKKVGIGGAATLFLSSQAYSFLKPIVGVDNPLEFYPERGWEKVYRNQYKYDSSFTFVCSPNDTHACRVRAFVRNGVLIRTEQNYDVQRYGDLYGNKASCNWNPRMCPKGYTLAQRMYGPNRLKNPVVRKGWREWAKDSFPYLTPELKKKYKFDSRGSDELQVIDWNEAFDLAAQAMMAIAKMYNGEEGKRRLQEEGYVPEMIERTEGAGIRTLKFRGGMGLLGVIGKFGMFRFSNMMALLDSHVRGVGEEKAVGGRSWDNYTEHGDQAPGYPFVHGLQTTDCDFNDLRFTKLHIQCGKNLVENKMPESHWFIESIERGAKVVTITPEYSPPATKSDYWLPVRPASDAAIFLGVSKILIDRKWYDEDFVKKFTDLPLLVRKDNLKRLHASEVFAGYKPGLSSEGASFKEQGLTKEQYEKLGDYVVRDASSNEFKAITRDDVGNHLKKKEIDPLLEWKGEINLVDGKTVEAMTLWEAYKIHLKDYDLESVAEITQAPKRLIEQLAKDFATIKPVAIHIGEGINHWFHATEVNRATFLPLMLTGNIGQHGAGSFTWAGNYKSANFQAAPSVGAGLGVWVAEDPFHPALSSRTPGKEVPVKNYALDEGASYWAHGDHPLVVETPKFGRKMFTGKTHMPTPTKGMWFTNVNHINNSKWAYQVIKNVLPTCNMIAVTDIELNGTIEYCDIAFPASWWAEIENFEVTSSCSNPFLQIWKGSLKPPVNTRDDVQILAGVAKRLGEILKDNRFADYWKFALEGKTEVYIQRLLDASMTLHGYKFDDIISGKYGEPGAALMLFRTYPRIPLWEQVNENKPFFTDTGRLNSYCDIPEAIEYGENFIVHREGPEATPYLPNAIVSSNPMVRPENYGLSPDEMDAEARHVRNIKLPWQQVKATVNPLWKQGFHFYCVTPKTRHTVHSQWSNVTWNRVWASNFADQLREDKRQPDAADHQIHINPQAAKDLGISDGDYVYVDANPADRPYIGWKPDDPFYKVARLMLRAKYNPAYPYHVVMIKHGTWIATEKTVKAHESRPDGRALSETGYQANFRYGSQQSITREWAMPMHQTDTLFHKAKIGQRFLFGGEADNHMINTVPKETLVRVVKAEDGGLGGHGKWEGATTGRTPGDENVEMRRYLNGGFVKKI
ncbi:MAG: molybdopterin-dependent oxidoreductase [Deltaproteobacteria bacterium]|nr:molybdopterin-dependent oxidoreductase [Deltaproteobacteria bacterium]